MDAIAAPGRFHPNPSRFTAHLGPGCSGGRERDSLVTGYHPGHGKGRGGVECGGRPHKTGKDTSSKGASIRVIGPWCQHLKVILLKPGQKPLEAKPLSCPDLPGLTRPEEWRNEKGLLSTAGLAPHRLAIDCHTPPCSLPSGHRPHWSL